MITLYNCGPAWGLPDPSPFVRKVETPLRMAKLPYRTEAAGFAKAPKGKIPYIDDFHPLAYREKIQHRLRSGFGCEPESDRLGIRENGRRSALLGRRARPVDE